MIRCCPVRRRLVSPPPPPPLYRTGPGQSNKLTHFIEDSRVVLHEELVHTLLERICSEVASRKSGLHVVVYGIHSVCGVAINHKRVPNTYMGISTCVLMGSHRNERFVCFKKERKKLDNACLYVSLRVVVH